MKSVLKVIPVRLYALAGFITLFLFAFAINSCGVSRYRTTHGHHHSFGAVNKASGICSTPGW